MVCNFLFDNQFALKFFFVLLLHLHGEVLEYDKQVDILCSLNIVLSHCQFTHTKLFHSRTWWGLFAVSSTHYDSYSWGGWQQLNTGYYHLAGLLVSFSNSFFFVWTEIYLENIYLKGIFWKYIMSPASTCMLTFKITGVM